MKRCLIFAAGTFYGLRQAPAPGDLVIAADAGYRACREAGCRLYLPPLSLCGDNSAMIGAQGYYEYLAGHTAAMDLNAYATRDLSE